MPGLSDALVNFFADLACNISGVQESARRCGGACTWKFSQSLEPVRSLIAKADASKAGICETIAAQWVCDEARGRSTKEWLTGSKGDDGTPDTAKLALIAQTHGLNIQSPDQESATERWMRTNGVPPRKGMFEDMDGGVGQGASKIDPEALVSDFMARARKPNVALPLHALISIGEQNRILGKLEHAMAIKVEPINAATIKYFDPNYGEFLFPTYDRFKTWFLDYYQKSNYAKYMGTFYKLRYF